MAHRAVPDNGRGCLRAAALATDGSPGIGLGGGVAASGQAPGALDVRPVRVGPARLHVKSLAFERLAADCPWWHLPGCYRAPPGASPAFYEVSLRFRRGVAAAGWY